MATGQEQLSRSQVCGMLRQGSAATAPSCREHHHVLVILGRHHHVLVILGASGDLARKKIYPTIWWLFRDGLLPDSTRVVGFARSALTVELIREQTLPYLKVTPEDEPRLASFLSLQSFVRGQYNDEGSFRALDSHLRALPGGSGAHRLFYLALPPSVYTPVTRHLRHTCMGDG
ncbi:glucose-6-phosphate 1-dehydrogenase-like, partial [Myiozetetes cayanensis]|uniref:glucose-6-phosphate 1-dehydrogenase-like n=1 Tax=Myiozetetes cayanensis TaxID=478635 RepID=UPI00215DDBFA